MGIYLASSRKLIVVAPASSAFWISSLSIDVPVIQHNIQIQGRLITGIRLHAKWSTFTFWVVGQDLPEATREVYALSKVNPVHIDCENSKIAIRVDYFGQSLLALTRKTA